MEWLRRLYRFFAVTWSSMISQPSRKELFAKARHLALTRTKYSFDNRTFYFRSDNLIVQYEEVDDVIIIYDLTERPAGVYSNKRKYNRPNQSRIPDSVIEALLRETVLDELADV